MPVALLLCEGPPQSFDVRLLSVLLRGVVGEIRPSGGKDGFPNLVKSLRRSQPDTCGLCDGDFPRLPETWMPSDDAAEWTVGTECLGWRWRRKEVENYLLDPVVLQRALAWSDEQRGDYEAAVERVLSRLAPSTAARMALTAHAPRKVRVDTQVDPTASEAKIEELLRAKASAYNAGALIDEAALLSSYRELLPECKAGRFRPHGLSVFSGKSIAALLGNSAKIQDLHPSLKHIDSLGDAVIEAAAKALAPHEWLPEWNSLRQAVELWPARAPSPRVTDTPNPKSDIEAGAGR